MQQKSKWSFKSTKESKLFDMLHNAMWSTVLDLQRPLALSKDHENSTLDAYGKS
jgi:hypothetical protein